MVAADPISLSVTDTSHVGEARRAAAAITQALAFDETLAGRVAIAVTELASNLHRHAVGGEIVLQPLQKPKQLGIEILAIDRGPGLANVADAMRDGFSTGGTPGTGLGAVRRQAHEFDLFTESGGTILMARFWPGSLPDERGLQVGAVCLPLAGETACGDGWSISTDVATGRVAIMVADGLGHGVSAAKASRKAVEVFTEHASCPPLQIIELLHAGLRGTRGAAVAVVELLRWQSKLNFAGLGNISGMLLQGPTSRSLLSHNGTAGVEARRMQEFSYDWSAQSTLVLHSDGLAQHWSLSGHRGLMMKPPSIVAGLLYRDHRRVRDDATVLVAREALSE